jgi:hypothetical protein
MPVVQASLDNLNPWTSETAPKGRKNAGLSLNEWRNALQDFCDEELQAILDDPKQPAKKKTAAREWLDGIAGNHNAITRICDYTNGKPKSDDKVTQDTTIRVIVEHVDAGNQDQIAKTSRLAIAGD